jgi:hypothetical protein
MATLSAGAACSQCGEDEAPRVPFKLDALNDKPKDAASAPAAPTEAGAFSFSPPRAAPELDGAVLPLEGVHAVLLVDLDADSDRDVIALHASDARADGVPLVSLSVALREEAGFSSPLPGPALELGVGCTLTTATLSTLSPSKGLSVLDASCGDDTGSTKSYALFTLERAPRLLERLAVMAPAVDDARRVTLTISSEDVDADGHDDVAVDLALTAAELSSTATLRLPWLDRPMGIARDVREPEATFAALAQAAQNALAKQPEVAARTAAAVLALHSAVCRESQRALVMFSGAPGLTCGASKSLSRAQGTWIAANAAQGDLKRALDAYFTLTPDDERARKAADKTLAKLAPTANVVLTPGPAVHMATTPPVHLPPARFVTESLLYVAREGGGVLYDVERATESAAPTADNLVRDPSGALAVTGIERRCDGLSLRIERAPEVGTPYLAGVVLARPSVLGFAPEPGCKERPNRSVADGEGYRALGWAPQGVLMARGGEVRLIPLAIDGKAAGEPRALPFGMPRPAPLPLGRATSDASRYVLPTPFGVLVFGVTGEAPELWRPQGYAELSGRVGDAAISPSGRRVALSAGGRVYLLTKPSAASGEP